MVSRDGRRVAIMSANCRRLPGPGCRDGLASVHMTGELPEPQHEARASIGPEQRVAMGREHTAFDSIGSDLLIGTFRHRFVADFGRSQPR